MKSCLKQYSDDPVYTIYKKDSDSYSKSEVLRMILVTGFHFNSAKRLPNSKEDYILMSEGNSVTLDPSSSYCKKEKFPNYIIFTELGGNSAGNEI